MIKIKSHFVFLVPAICVLLGSVTTPAYAYLDPGTGTMILQGVIAAIGAGLGFAYYYFNRLKQFFKSLTGGNPAADESEISQFGDDENNESR